MLKIDDKVPCLGVSVRKVLTLSHDWLLTALLSLRSKQLTSQNVWGRPYTVFRWQSSGHWILDWIWIEQCLFLWKEKKKNKKQTNKQKKTKSPEEGRKRARRSRDAKFGIWTWDTLLRGEYPHHCAICAPYVNAYPSLFTYLPICALNSLLCSVHLSFSPPNPPISVEAASIFRRQVSASSRRSCWI